ncbi:protein of unknown function [Clostridium beijerinckii]|nr:protein of unknown function [Clostridium beijerinckii]
MNYFNIYSIEIISILWEFILKLFAPAIQKRLIFCIAGFVFSNVSKL